MNSKTFQRKQHITLLAQPAVETLTDIPTTLIVNDQDEIFPDYTNQWKRFSTSTSSGMTWLKAGQFTNVFIRLSPDKTAMKMTIHAVAGQMPTNATIWIVGANDEGIKSVPKMLTPFFTACETLEIRRRCRLIKAIRTDHPIQTSLDDWKTTGTITIDGKNTPWISYPGLFAKGKLDPATELLIEASKTIRPKRRVLDFGCGTGTISFAIRSRFPSIPIDALDHDALAILACKHNVANVECFNSNSWSGIPTNKYDLIISNPPIHIGKEEDTTVLQDLISESARRLTRRGSLLLVTQKRIPLEWEGLFTKSKVVAQSNRYKVIQLHF